MKNCLVNKNTVAILSPYFQYDFNHFIASIHDHSDAVELFTQLCYALEELFKLGYIHRSVCPEKVRVTTDPLRVYLAGYSTATPVGTFLRTLRDKTTYFTSPWKHLDDGSQLHDVYSVVMLIFRYEIDTETWLGFSTQRDLGLAIDDYLVKKDNP